MTDQPEPPPTRCEFYQVLGREDTRCTRAIGHNGPHAEPLPTVPESAPRGMVLCPCLSNEHLYSWHFLNEYIAEHGAWPACTSGRGFKGAPRAERCPIYTQIDYGVRCGRLRGHEGRCDDKSDEYVVAVLAHSQRVTKALRDETLESERWPEGVPRMRAPSPVPETAACRFTIRPDAFVAEYRCVLPRGHAPEDVHELEWTRDGAPPDKRAHLIVSIAPAPPAEPVEEAQRCATCGERDWHHLHSEACWHWPRCGHHAFALVPSVEVEDEGARPLSETEALAAINAWADSIDYGTHEHEPLLRAYRAAIRKEATAALECRDGYHKMIPLMRGCYCGAMRATGSQAYLHSLEDSLSDVSNRSAAKNHEIHLLRTRAEDAEGALRDVLAVIDHAYKLDFTNGVTDSTGSVDEGDVRSREIINRARALTAESVE